jgi:ferredoxin-NADP reductase
MPKIFELKVKEVIPRTYNVKSVRLEIGEETEYQAGQFLCATLKTEGSPKRYLSISSSPTERGFIEFTKKLTASDFSRGLERLRPGDIISVQYPFGKFTLDPQAKKIAFLSGGIGITPIRSICKYAVDKDLGTDIILLYANRTTKDIAFKDDLAAMQQQYPKLKVMHVLSDPEPGYQGLSGRINAQVIKEQIPDYPERKFYLCGPPQMVEAMKAILSSELQLAQEKIITENFTGY